MFFLLFTVTPTFSKITFLEEIQTLIVYYIVDQYLLTLQGVQRSDMNIAIIFLESLYQNTVIVF